MLVFHSNSLHRSKTTKLKVLYRIKQCRLSHLCQCFAVLKHTCTTCVLRHYIICHCVYVINIRKKSVIKLWNDFHLFRLCNFSKIDRETFSLHYKQKRIENGSASMNYSLIPTPVRLSLHQCTGKVYMKAQCTGSL